ncbi:MAG: type I glyceraldehyde-3-phosphate dehydrogenase [Candidatus Sungbacteria bacterium RIFCSPLOWO2_02_FULL_51_17]|uniref:Type I glyceraldehyde-3-phosphate dehydrogenase n=1 Tax=Candidatus Sungbacteria bacterium RIFCSPHIGHO2_02_FULL_51_29 TaxID=1802273 RepID=A0A1G2KW74_9BACT|nr:MAG: type I glyceraldehyde-3-phosphate dehydrogenase [Candidatus Sungbacteria bacterium RIFCSPHIGHO2_01_FULL_51_22]OHA03688.1 MAG: type I glyceraldehyde-3-phosphate dehydrogenase [Candidatus Sungbacteria bacterium RIFCSPHIGHO2_02_FULL_51_29]OHA07328.1 MAG: type I glyceraldehyde-3-phosphate dehydrogenase [Candidatus Sungbacteria bacterium RIFCSPLOWO2_01_FULL_51_34]OHA11291.1 MAG: type I glyceraldehyde-3-phosphate dehydrogenase [Candidatus Sungbacteria bacterium RIFCSPLOWO2_02_FULL_51_17]
MINVAINGFGRIGRSFFRLAFGSPDIQIVAVNDLTDPATLAYLLTYDSAYGRYAKKVEAFAEHFAVDGAEVKIFAEREPQKLPWKDLGVDVVVESTGFYTDAAKARVHLDAGAKHVVITAPASGELDTALVGVNDEKFIGGCGPITSNASCTTNASAPVMAILREHFGIQKAFLQTVHGYTATQKLVDGPDPKDMRRGRAAAVNIVPSSTGAAESVIKVIPELEGIFDGIAIRVPVITGSLVMITALLSQKTTAAEINDVFRRAALEPRWSKSVKVTEDQVVSTDIIGEPYGAVVDLGFTKVVDGDLATVYSWYDNEFGYTTTLVEHVRRVAKAL